MAQQGAYDQPQHPRLAMVPSPHLELGSDAKGVILWVSEWTELATGWPRQQLVGCLASAKLRDPGEDPRLVDDGMFEAFWKDAPLHPGQRYTFKDTYVRHADGHRMEVPYVTFYWDGLPSREQYLINLELTEEEIHRVRSLYPSQFANIFERAHFSNFINGPEHQARVRRDIAIQQEVKKHSSLRQWAVEVEDLHTAAASPRMNKWDNKDELRELLRQIHVEEDEWDNLKLTDYCERLEAKAGGVHISISTLRSRFRIWGWGLPDDALRQMALEDTADRQLPGFS